MNKKRKMRTEKKKTEQKKERKKELLSDQSKLFLFWGFLNFPF